MLLQVYTKILFLQAFWMYPQANRNAWKSMPVAPQIHRCLRTSRWHCACQGNCAANWQTKLAWPRWKGLRGRLPLNKPDRRDLLKTTQYRYGYSRNVSALPFVSLHSYQSEKKNIAKGLLHVRRWQGSLSIRTLQECLAAVLYAHTLERAESTCLIAGRAPCKWNSRCSVGLPLPCQCTPLRLTDFTHFVADLAPKQDPAILASSEISSPFDLFEHLECINMSAQRQLAFELAQFWILRITLEPQELQQIILMAWDGRTQNQPRFIVFAYLCLKNMCLIVSDIF